MSRSDTIARAKALKDLSTKFEESARTVAMTIIDELHLPEEAKTVHSVDSVGGIAGGEKYIEAYVQAWRAWCA